MGRLFAQSASLQNLPKEFRGAIGANYHHIDMVNCHPSILLQYCKKNDIKSDALEYYVNNRNEVVEKIMTDYSLEKGDVKQLFLSVMNGGKRDGILDPFFVKFKTECERVYTSIASSNPFFL
jgi:coenzyme F420-reducing hydrogenase delta subunit